MVFRFFALGMLGLGLASTVNAANLTAPYDLETADVLPPNVRNPRFKSIYMTIDERYQGDGLIEPLGERLNKRVTWDDVINSKETETERNVVRGFLRANDIDDTGSPGNSSGSVTTTLDVKVPVLAMGITDRWTMALAVPIYKIEIRAQTSFVGNGQGQKFLDDLSGSNPVRGQETKDQLNNAVNSKLTRNGYQEIRSETLSSIGDVKLISKYKVHQDDWNTFTWRAELTAPTGVPPNADKAVDVPSGDGQWDIGAGLIWDHKLSSSFKINSHAGYTLQLPDRLDRRIPKAYNDSISPDKVQVFRDSGDVFMSGVSLNYSTLENALLLGVGYSYQFMGRTRFYGGEFAAHRYHWLEDLYPEQSIHAATARAGFSTVDWFRAQKFVYPFQAYVVYSRPMGGRNVTTNDIVAGELVLFF